MFVKSQKQIRIFIKIYVICVDRQIWLSFIYWSDVDSHGTLIYAPNVSLLYIKKVQNLNWTSWINFYEIYCICCYPRRNDITNMEISTWLKHVYINKIQRRNAKQTKLKDAISDDWNISQTGWTIKEIKGYTSQFKHVMRSYQTKYMHLCIDLCLYIYTLL